MVRHYKSDYETATSAPVEGYFSHAKNELRQSLSIIDRFVGSRLLSIEGELKMARSLQITSQESKSKNYIEANNSIDSEQIKCNEIESNKSTDIIYQDEKNRDIDMNSNLNDDSELNFHSENDTNINSDKSDINLMITDELMVQENWKNKAEKLIKIKKKKNKFQMIFEIYKSVSRYSSCIKYFRITINFIISDNLLPAVKVNKKKKC